MPKIETTGLVFDPSIYPRKGIDAYNVLKLRRAIEGGSKLPPVLTCRSTYKIIDGVHRWTLAKERGEATSGIAVGNSPQRRRLSFDHKPEGAGLYRHCRI